MGWNCCLKYARWHNGQWNWSCRYHLSRHSRWKTCRHFKSRISWLRRTESRHIALSYELLTLGVVEGRGTPCKLIAFIIRRKRRDLGSGPPFLECTNWGLGVEFAEASFAGWFLGFLGARGAKATSFAVVGVAVAVVDEDGETPPISTCTLVLCTPYYVGER